MRCGCAMDMVDGALEMLDVVLFSRRMGGVVVACLAANGSGFVARLRVKFPNFPIFSRYAMYSYHVEKKQYVFMTTWIFPTAV